MDKPLSKQQELSSVLWPSSALEENAHCENLEWCCSTSGWFLPLSVLWSQWATSITRHIQGALWTGSNQVGKVDSFLSLHEKKWKSLYICPPIQLCPFGFTSHVKNVNVKIFHDTLLSSIKKILKKWKFQNLFSNIKLLTSQFLFTLHAQPESELLLNWKNSSKVLTLHQWETAKAVCAQFRMMHVQSSR